MHRLRGAKLVPAMLTDVFIRAAPPGTYWDSSLKGFGVRVGRQTKSFIVLVASGRRHSIGRYPLVSLSDARKEARRILAEKQLGKVRPTHVAFDDAKAAFLAECEKKNKPRTVRGYARLLNRHFPFGRQSVGDIHSRQIVLTLNKLADTPSEKQHAFTAARVFFRWCVRQHLIEHSPMEHMQAPHLGKARERVLSDEELVALWEGTERQSTFSAIVRVLILTGQRRGEVARFEWEWLEDDLCTIPSGVTKNGRTQTFPLPPKAQALIAAMPRLKDSPFVFPAYRHMSATTTVFNGWSAGKAELDRRLPLEPWTIHDLRRTFASGMASLGVPQIVVEKLLNHVSGGTQSPIAQVYNRYSYLPEMREAVLKWDRHLDTLISPRA